MPITKLNIDLGSDSMDAHMSSPMMPMMPMKSEKYYPKFHYSGDKELEIPDEGTMTIRYREVASSERENRDGSENYTCEIEVQEIVSVEGDASAEAPAKSYGKDTGDALDALRKKKMDMDEGE